MTMFFLVEVPFSKIWHYNRHPFGRVNCGMIVGGLGALNESLGLHGKHLMACVPAMLAQQRSERPWRKQRPKKR